MLQQPALQVVVELLADKLRQAASRSFDFLNKARVVLRMEDTIGSLEVGKRADLIIIDQDIFELTPDEIWNTNVFYTMMNGNITFRDGI